MSDLSIHDPTGRRRFLATVGLAGLAASMGVGTAHAQSATPAPATPAPAAPSAPPAAAPPAEPSEDARALAGIVERRYGAHLEPGDLKEITEELDYRLTVGKRLRSAPLVNADEPDATFRA